MTLFSTFLSLIIIHHKGRGNTILFRTSRKERKEKKSLTGGKEATLHYNTHTKSERGRGWQKKRSNFYDCELGKKKWPSRFLQQNVRVQKESKNPCSATFFKHHLFIQSFESNFLQEGLTNNQKLKILLHKYFN